MEMLKYPRVTKKIALQLIKKETGSGASVTRSKTQISGGRYEALRGQFFITITANWPDGDTNHFVVDITDGNGGLIRHYYNSSTLDRDFRMDSLEIAENRLEYAIDIVVRAMSAQSDIFCSPIDILTDKLRKIRLERSALLNDLEAPKFIVPAISPNDGA